MPDEYLPPNKILFLQNLPESVTKDQLVALFSQCVLKPSYSFLVNLSIQIPQPLRSPSHSNQEGHCLRRVCGRGQRHYRKGAATQLQAGRREQDQGRFGFGVIALLANRIVRLPLPGNDFSQTLLYYLVVFYT